MADIGQDFTIYAGNDSRPVVTIYSDATNTTPLDISSVVEVVWTVRRDLTSSVLLTKTKSSGKITLPGGGTDGQFTIQIDAADTAALTGFYIHQASITEVTSGLVTTVTTGRLQVGQAPLWTYSGDPTLSNKDAVRFLIGDTLVGDPQIYDGEVLYCLTLRGTVYGAAAQCCRSLSSQYSRRADSVQGELRITYSTLSKAYAQRAIDYENREAIQGGKGLAYAGGISISDKGTRALDTDRQPPQFNLGMTDSRLPVAPSGNEVLSTDEVGGNNGRHGI